MGSNRINTPKDSLRYLIQRVGGEQSSVIQLAATVSMASIIDWALLRRARLQLLPELNPGTEAELWASPLVQSRGPYGFVLRTDAAHWLRQKLVDEGEHRLQKVWNLLKNEHHYLAPILRQEELLIYQGISTKYSASQIEEELQKIARASMNQDRLSIAIWIERALERLPPKVQSLDTILLLNEVARRYRSENTDFSDLTDSTFIKDYPTVPFFLRLVNNVLEITPQEYDQPDRKSEPVQIDVPKTQTLFIDLQWNEEEESFEHRLILDQYESVLYRVGRDLTIRFADGTRFSVASKLLFPEKESSTSKFKILDLPKATVPAEIIKVPEIDHPDLYFNRELSWLDFNWRVLFLSMDKRVPLLERVRFLSVASSNLDEFFRTRVGGLKRQMAAGVPLLSPDGRTPVEQILLIAQAVPSMYKAMGAVWNNDLRPAMRNDADVWIKKFSELTSSERHRVNKYFHEQLFPILTPLAVDPGHPFPFISNLSLSLASSCGIQ